MTNTEAKVKRSIETHPSYSNAKIGGNITPKVSAAIVAKIRSKLNLPEPIQIKKAKELVHESPTTATGFKLAGCRVLSRRPAETAAKHIRRLPDGKGFLISDLSKEWGISEETIRRYAKDLNCLRYVEVEQDEWQQLVISPNTATKFPQ